MTTRTVTITLLFSFLFYLIPQANAGDFHGLLIPKTDEGDTQLIGYFDLRDRESFVQITHTNSNLSTIHVQFFDVSNNCNENNFFDSYTGNDTHVYNLRDIVSNDGNPSGVVLPDNAYGIVAFTYSDEQPPDMIGNLRILDANGYEYRTNLAGTRDEVFFDIAGGILTFNFNAASGVIFSDIVGIPIDRIPGEIVAANITDVWTSFDVDIYDLNEVPFSCRDVVFSCVNEDNPLLEQLLEETGSNVASFEYGINNAIPHSKGAELLCPGNTISEGFVRLDHDNFNPASINDFVLFIGLNNGNGRGSFDSEWSQGGLNISTSIEG